MLEKKLLDALQDLGLTFLQARVYVALLALGSSTGRIVAKKAIIAQQDVYHILAELQEKGIVEKIITKPYKYRPTTLDNGLSILLKRRQERTDEITKIAGETSVFLNLYQKEAMENNYSFVLVPEREPIEKMVDKIYNTAEKSIDFINDCEEYLIGFEKHKTPRIEALKRGISIRVILGNGDNCKLPASFEEFVRNNKSFQVRESGKIRSAKLIVKDRKEVLISTSIKRDTLRQPHLWSDNPVLVEILAEGFDSMWKQACSINLE